VEQVKFVNLVPEEHVHLEIVVNPKVEFRENG